MAIICSIGSFDGGGPQGEDGASASLDPPTGCTQNTVSFHEFRSRFSGHAVLRFSMAKMEIKNAVHLINLEQRLFSSRKFKTQTIQDKQQRHFDRY